MMTCKLKQYRGVTTLELMVAIAIVGIITMLAIPMFSYFLNNNTLKAATERLYHDLNYARSEAIKRQQAVNVIFQSGSNWCYGLTTATSCNCLVVNNCNLGQVSYNDFYDTSLGVSGISTITSFDGSRGLASTTGTLSFSTSDGDSTSISLNKLGITSICSDKLSEYPGC